MRRQVRPEAQRAQAAAIAAGQQLDPAEAERRLLRLEQWHDSLWHTCNRPEAIAARAALAAAQAGRRAA